MSEEDGDSASREPPRAEMDSLGVLQSMRRESQPRITAPSSSEGLSPMVTHSEGPSVSLPSLKSMGEPTTSLSFPASSSSADKIELSVSTSNPNGDAVASVRVAPPMATRPTTQAAADSNPVRPYNPFAMHSTAAESAVPMNTHTPADNVLGETRPVGETGIDGKGSKGVAEKGEGKIIRWEDLSMKPTTLEELQRVKRKDSRVCVCVCV
jgi:hypothetical protein